MTQGMNFCSRKGVEWSQGRSRPSVWHLVSVAGDLTTLSDSLLDWDDLFSNSSMLEMQSTGLLLLCNLTTFDFSPFLDLCHGINWAGALM